MPERFAFPLHRDARGDLVVVDFDTVPFTVRRNFTISGVPAGVARGQHPLICEELLVVVAGSAVLTVDGEEHELALGEGLHVRPGSYISYVMGDAASTLLALADQPFGVAT